VLLIALALMAIFVIPALLRKSLGLPMETQSPTQAAQASPESSRPPTLV